MSTTNDPIWKGGDELAALLLAAGITQDEIDRARKTGGDYELNQKMLNAIGGNVIVDGIRLQWIWQKRQT